MTQNTRLTLALIAFAVLVIGLALLINRWYPIVIPGREG